MKKILLLFNFILLFSCLINAMDNDKITPSDPRYFLSIALKNYNSQNYNAAIFNCNKAIDMDSTIVISYSIKAMSEMSLGMNKEAISDFTTAINQTNTEKDKKSLYTLYQGRGGAKNQLGDYSGAIRDFSKAIELNPTKAESYFLRAIAKTDIEDYAGGLADCNKGFKIKSNYGQGYYTRALCKYGLGNKNGAIEDLSMAGELGIEKAYEQIEIIRKE